MYTLLFDTLETILFFYFVFMNGTVTLVQQCSLCES